MIVAPAKAGAHPSTTALAPAWIPAFAGVTIKDTAERDMARATVDA